MDSIWECRIRSARGILASFLQTPGHRFDEESMKILITETKVAINSRPLTLETNSDGQSFKPLSPNNLLTIKLTVMIPPP